ncbi:hypothetical protein AHS21_004902 [Salmonella enterica subsp. enterica]|nr:hypothetical protein [Salmonella enterica subsp. enterica serovar Lexington]
MSIHNFPEVYHGQGTSEAVFSVLCAGSQGRLITQHLVAMADERAATSCVYGVYRAGSRNEDPTLTISGSDRKKRESVCTVPYCMY